MGEIALGPGATCFRFRAEPRGGVERLLRDQPRFIAARAMERRRLAIQQLAAARAPFA